ncbi:MAG TPA: ATP-binding protein [Acetobacteraceae bacterium]|nr:ATP-binding protein [Acetobacteraceae bacterium]
MKLSRRLLLLILGCLLPILAAQVYSQVNLHAQRQAQMGLLALRQAELVNDDFVSIVAAVSQLASVAAQFPEIHSGGAACNERLRAIQRSLPPYRFLAITDSSGSLMCASLRSLLGQSGKRPAWLDGTGAPPAHRVGRLSTAPDIDGTFLPIAAPMPNADNEAERPNLLVAALDTHWLASHLGEAQTLHADRDADATIIVTDRDGTVVTGLPRGEQETGRSISERQRKLIAEPASMITGVHDEGGTPTVTAVVPIGLPPEGLAIIVSLSLRHLTTDLDSATFRNLLVIGWAALVALLLAWLAGRRFIYQPTEALLHAARRWRDGDLTARATPNDAGSEFAALAQSFNAMAAGLQARDLERRLQAQFLEAQVAERTRELSESNNRLQVEINGREKTEAALHQAQKLQAVGQLAGGIAHDYNNMLATVLGNLELMERRMASDPRDWTDADIDRMARLIERATGAVQRGGQLTSRLLAFSRRQRLETRPTDINRLVGELITLATSTLGRRVRVVSQLSEDLWPALVDPSQVEAAILNLCLNARDAMEDGGQLTITTFNEVLEITDHEDDLPPGPYVRISVRDTGTGMDPEIRQRAFEPFFTTKGPRGSGLGLSQVYGMAKQSGGTVRIESSPGVGTEVSIVLPRAVEDEGWDPATGTNNHASPRRALPADLVMVVDDDHAVRQVTVELVRDLGCEVIQAAGGIEALALLDEVPRPPAIILIDYAMPEMNGLQLARLLRERGIAAPIALVTGYAELAESDAQASQLSGLLRKPFTIQELQALLIHLHGRAEQNRSARPVHEPLPD